MRTTLGSPRRAALAVGSALTLAALGLATPAHAAPSHPGKPAHAASHDKHAETGKKPEATKKAGPARKSEQKPGEDRRASSNKDGRGHNDKWQAQADPDGDENGGIDQPGGTGGTIGQQDGNNGSGNDADCEDDNRGKGVPGHCKDKPMPSAEQPGSEQPGSEQPGSEQPSGYPTSPTEGLEGDEGAAPGTTPSTGPGESVPSSVTTPVVLGVEQLAAAVRPAHAVAGPAAAAPAERTPERTATPVARAAAVLPNTGSAAENAALLAGGLGAVAAGTVLLRRRRADVQA